MGRVSTCQKNCKNNRPARCAGQWSVTWPDAPCDLYEGIRQYDLSDTGHSDNVNIAAEHQEPAEVLSQLDNTSNSPVYGEY